MNMCRCLSLLVWLNLTDEGLEVTTVLWLTELEQILHRTARGNDPDLLLFSFFFPSPPSCGWTMPLLSNSHISCYVSGPVWPAEPLFTLMWLICFEALAQSDVSPSPLTFWFRLRSAGQAWRTWSWDHRQPLCLYSPAAWSSAALIKTGPKHRN